MTASTYTRGRAVLTEGSSQLVADYEAAKLATNAAYGRLRQTQKTARIRLLKQEIERNPPSFPDGRFPVVVMDPPWPYPDGMLPYPTMPLDQISALPVPELLAADAIVWLWTTNRFLDDALDLAR